MLKLQFTDNRQSSFWIVDEEFGIGRDLKNQLVIKDDQVQPFHAKLKQKNHRVFIEPVDAAVIRINGALLTEQTELMLGDLIGIDQIELTLIDPTRQAKAALPSGSKSKPSLKAVSDTKWQIKAMTGPLAGKLMNVDGMKRIGRDPASEIVVSGGHVSRRHAELLLRDEQLWIRDLGSSNGTYVNGKKTHEQPLFLGDEVKVDAVVFRVVQGLSPKAAPAAEAENLDKTQFHPALKMPPAPSPSRPRPITPPPAVGAPQAADVAPIAATDAPVVSTSVESAPAASNLPKFPPAEPAGLRISPLILLAMVLVLLMLTALIFAVG